MPGKSVAQIVEEKLALRDIFAGLAMHGLVVREDGDLRNSEDLAELAYWIADAMLGARKR